MRILFVVIALLFSFNLRAQDLDSLNENVEYEISQVGVYKGSSLYLHNPYVRSDGNFCINEILINDQVWEINTNKPAIEISFNESLLYKPVALRIKHKYNCVPKILNPDAIVIHSSFKFVELNLNDSVFSWITKGDRKGAEYRVERLSVDTWLIDTLIQANGVFAGANYEYRPLQNSGTNKFRIKYSLPSGRYLYSNEVENEYYPEPVEISPLVVTDKLTLSRAVEWEITTVKGRSIISGSRTVIPLKRLRPGDYYIRLGEEQIESFIKK